MRFLYDKAEAGSLSHQVLYLMLLSPTLMSITHYSTYLFTAAPITALYVHILHRYGARERPAAPNHFNKQLAAQSGSVR